MKNLKTVCTILICVLYSTINAQDKKDEQHDIATFEIYDARSNGIDITPDVLKKKESLFFYKIGDSNAILLSRFFGETQSQSYGIIYSVVKNELPATETEYKADMYNFQWSYANSFDDQAGTAKAELLIVYKPQGVYFELDIESESLDVLVYKGLMSGDLTDLESSIEK